MENILRDFPVLLELEIYQNSYYVTKRTFQTEFVCVTDTILPFVFYTDSRERVNEFTVSCPKKFSKESLPGGSIKVHFNDRIEVLCSNVIVLQRDYFPVLGHDPLVIPL